MNTGLIEVMGFAVLPSRLKEALTDLSQALVAGEDIHGKKVLFKYTAWVYELKKQHNFTADNVIDILMQEIGTIFAAVLEDAGVYKYTCEGRQAFTQFVTAVNNSFGKQELIRNFFIADSIKAQIVKDAICAFLIHA